MKDIEKVVAENVNKLLKEKNINKSDLAKIAGVSESTVGKWTLEKATPRMGAIQKISDYFNVPKSYILEEDQVEYITSSNYHYFPTAISAGLPINVDGITNDQVEKISLPDSVMGKWAGKQDIFITKINGDSMDKIMPHGSLIAVKPVTLDELKDGDMVVFSDNYDYSVKCFYQDGDRLIFKPESYNKKHADQIYSVNDNIEIHGKVILYIVERD